MECADRFVGRAICANGAIGATGGTAQAMRIVDLLPYPEQLYLEVCGLIFKEEEEILGKP